MRDTMCHRGPDGAGAWVSSDGRVGLGHRRLSIIDFSDLTNQPMSNADGNIQVVLNGEIYNHAEIWRELEANGPQILGGLLALYEWHGRHHVAHITGLRARRKW